LLSDGSILATFTFPSSLFAAFYHSGVNLVQWLHQGAYKYINQVSKDE